MAEDKKKPKRSYDGDAGDPDTRKVSSHAKQGIFWTAFFHGIEYVLQFGSSIVLARILFPADFGMMGLASIAIQLARRLANFGFPVVLVQIKQIREEHYDTVFWMNTVLMTIVAGIMFTGAPHFAEFFRSPDLTPVEQAQQVATLTLILRVLAFDFILQGMSSVPQAILKRLMRFKEHGMVITIGKFTTLTSTVVLAIMGYGVWALVIGTLFGSFCQRFAFLIVAPWWPGFKIRWWAFKDSFAFGMWVYVGAYLNYGINKVDFGLVGKFLGTTQLGFYERAFDLMSLPRKQLVNKITGVLFSTFSRIQDDNERLVKAMLRACTYMAFLAYPLMIWLFFVSPSLIVNIYGAKWAPVVLPLQIMCITGIVDSFTMLFQPLSQAKGWIGHNVRRDAVYLSILTVGVLVGLKWGIIGVAWGITGASFIRLGLMLHIIISRLPMSLMDFVKAQRSILAYGLVQIGVLMTMQWGTGAWWPVDSVPMLMAVTILSPITFFGAHAVMRFPDIRDIMGEFTHELRKFARKFPIIRNLAFVKKKRAHS